MAPPAATRRHASSRPTESDSLNLLVVILTIRVTPVLSQPGGLAAAAGGPKAARQNLKSSKNCNVSNLHGRALKASLGNLRSEGYEMGLAKGRAFTSESAACCRPFRRAKSRWKV